MLRNLHIQDIYYYATRELGLSSNPCGRDKRLQRYVVGSQHREEYLGILTALAKCSASSAIVCCYDPERGCYYGVDCGKLTQVAGMCITRRPLQSGSGICVDCVEILEKQCSDLISKLCRE